LAGSLEPTNYHTGTSAQNGIDARLLEIDRRYTTRRKRARPSIVALRIADLRRVRVNLYGRTIIADTPAGRYLCRVVAIHMARGLEPAKRIPSWLSLYAPWFTSAEAYALVEEVTDTDDDTDQFLVPLPSADNLGWALKITVEQRKAWGLTTIGALGDTKTLRKKRRKANAKARAARNRLAAGATPRAASKTQTEPWVACGMKRATWYRKGQPAPRLRLSLPPPI
jgi:hypothetical protein